MHEEGGRGKSWRGGLVAGALAVGVAVVWASSGSAGPEELPLPGRPAPGLLPTARLSLHGNTPALAWAPDGKHVAVNGAFEYMNDTPGDAAPDTWGVFVVEPATHSAKRVSDDQGFHPLWLDAKTVAWGHSPYEFGTAGLYVSPSDHAAPQRIGKVEGVYHTRAAPGGKVLYFSGFPEYKGWVVADAKTGAVKVVDKEGSSWAPPAAHLVEQCHQSVGPVSVVSQDSVEVPGLGPTGIPQHAVTVNGQRKLLDGIAYTYNGDSGTGVVKPCLSPDGTYVAWLTESDDPSGGYAVNVAVVPR